MERIKESLLSRLWQSDVMRNRELVTAGGEWLRVVYPGRRDGVGGPDFRHAIIATNGGELRGDVELHVRSSGWQAHGHHRDPNYNGVILHVVMWDDRDGGTVLQDGRVVPVLPLHPYVDDLGGFPTNLVVPEEPCGDVVMRLGEHAVGEVLDGAGEERFRSKAGNFQAKLDVKERDQVLYEGLMRALGYSRNSESFEELARRMPIKTLREIAQDSCLEKHGQVFQRALSAEAALLEWHLAGIRPPNMPQRRIIAAAYLLARYLRNGGLVQGLLQLIRETGIKNGHRKLEDGLMVTGGEHGALIGRGRAGEIVVNIVLPFLFALGGARIKPGRHALELYRNYPRLGENQITRQMTRQIHTGPGLINSTRRQQGLIQIYREICLDRRCGECPLMPV
ncbi:MAG: DUF2851 family protein [Dehalococcoidia bacterium]